jgi:transcriptional regulator with XRE-family HTH domain
MRYEVARPLDCASLGDMPGQAGAAHDGQRGTSVGKSTPGEDRSPISRALDHLLRTHKDESGNHVSVEDVAAGINAKGLSAPYIYALRSGSKRNPTVATLQALADYFGVHVGFFFGTEPTGAPVSTAPAPEAPAQAVHTDTPAEADTHAAEPGEHAVEPSDTVSKVNLAARIEHLFNLRLRPDGAPWSMRQVSAAAKKRGVSLSVGFLHDLRRGIKDNPTKQQLECLADIFGVRPGYFFDDDDTLAAVNEKLRMLGALEDDRVAHIALRTRGLSAHDYRLLNALIDSAISDREERSQRGTTDLD